MVAGFGDDLSAGIGGEAGRSQVVGVYEEGELDPKATVKKYLTVRREGNRQVERSLEYYNLDIIISVGYRIKKGTNRSVR